MDTNFRLWVAVLISGVTLLGGSVAQAQDPTPGLPPPLPTVTPAPVPIETPTPPPLPIETPAPPVDARYAYETTDDTTTVANGYVTIFHAGRAYYPKPLAGEPLPTPFPTPTPVDGPQSEDEATMPASAPTVTVTSISGAAVSVTASTLFVDKSGNPVNPTALPPGTRMQAVEVVDDATLGQVVRKIVVDR